MRITIETKTRRLTLEDDGNVRTLDLYGREAFELISSLWLKTGWNQKYSYTFTWLGRPIIQHPEDLVRLQEVIYNVAPDVIVETGVAHGGSLVFHASLLKAIGRGGRVIGVDVEIRPHNRQALETHVLAPMITLIEGDSIAPETVASVRRLIHPGDTVLAFKCQTVDVGPLAVSHGAVRTGNDSKLQRGPRAVRGRARDALGHGQPRETDDRRLRACVRQRELHRTRAIHNRRGRFWCGRAAGE